MRHHPVDLRSDTVTRPTPEMRRAMAEAEVGDDVFGDDPTVLRLEEETAGLLGKEAALFVPSGTMGNEVAIAAHTRRGDEAICEATAHIFLYEGGGPALLSGVQLYPLPGSRGMLSIEQFRRARRPLPQDPHHPVSRLLCLENTHNRAGGAVLPFEAVRALCAEASGQGILTHLDGARLWNAAAATGIEEARWAALFDSVSVCFSKGLGAPVGSAVAGSRAWVQEARHYRKRLGGGMRQVGIIAAGALHALRHHRARLAEDHERARRLASGLAGLPGLALDPASVETNIIVAPLSETAASPAHWCAALAQHEVLAVAFGDRALRLVLHLDVNEEDLDHALAVFRQVAPGLAGGAA
jgi:threonine aldolase